MSLLYKGIQRCLTGRHNCINLHGQYKNGKLMDFCLKHSWNRSSISFIRDFTHSTCTKRSTSCSYASHSTLLPTTAVSSSHKPTSTCPSSVNTFLQPRRCMSSQHDKFFPQGSSSSRTKLYYTLKHYIRSPENAETFVSHLKEDERKLLLTALEMHHSTSAETGEETGKISSRQLRLVFLHNCIPFIGFGFLDNAIMILAGEYIDHTIGLTLGISTMAAAALGNIVSDLAGIGLAGYVEMLFYKLGLPVPALTPEQAEQTSAVVSSNMGKAFGIIIGCIIGMFPLLFAKELVGGDEDEEKD